MSEPVVVIHGVGNRDKNAFDARVARLQADVHDKWTLVPVYWGDLAAHEELVSATVPEIVGIRGDYAASTSTLDVIFGPPGAALEGTVAVRDDTAKIDAVLRGAHAVSGVETRDSDVQLPPDFDDSVRSEWPQLTWLQQFTDPAVLERVGVAVAAPLVETARTDVNGEVETRDDGSAEVRLSMPDVGGFVRRRLHDLDALVGTIMRDTAGRTNEFMRSRYGPGITEFFGDVLVYQRHRQEIHQRVRDTLATLNDPSLGSSAHPVFVAGHSLGGVIAFDIATLPDAQDPLWTKSLVTFGSQAPFFHVCDPREGLPEYSPGHRVTLPGSLARWTNLWESLDVVAFIAAKVFVLHDGTSPEDIEVKHLASWGLWTHSVYWSTPDLINALTTAFS